MSCTDQELQEGMDHYLLLGQVEDIIDRVRHGESILDSDRSVLTSLGIDVASIEEEFCNG